jgi:hypothetical protein
MKKITVILLTLVLILGTAGTTLAAPANPFGDVPAAHWSYDAVRVLVQAGLIDRVDLGRWQEGKSLTRYEMAQLAARAVWNAAKAGEQEKVLIEKLAKEYANELESLGVLRAKPAKPVKSAVVGGDARIRWVDDGSGTSKFAQRLRLNINSQVNGNTDFYGRFIGLNNSEMGTYHTTGDADRFNVADAAFTTKNLFNTANTLVTVGRFSQRLGQLGYFMDTAGGVEGLKVTAGNKLRLTAGFANFSVAYDQALGILQPSPRTGNAEIRDAFFTQGVYPASKATTVSGFWLKEKTGVDSNFDVKSLGFTSKLSPEFTLAGDYGKNFITHNGGQPVFQHTRLTYGTLDVTKPGSWSLATEYHKFESGSFNLFYSGYMIGPLNNAKAWSSIASVTLAPNVFMDAIYTFNARKVSDNTDIANYTRLQIWYLF